MEWEFASGEQLTADHCSVSTLTQGSLPWNDLDVDPHSNTVRLS